MGYIGKKPTPVPLTASDVTDGIISNAKLAQDVISAETALAVAPADTDEFLVSDAGTLKRIDYSLIKGGGEKTLLATTTVSSAVANVTFDNSYFTSTYRDYVITASQLDVDTDSANIYMQISSDNGSTFKSSGAYRYAVYALEDTAGSITQYGTAATAFHITSTPTSEANARTTSFRLYLINPLSTSTFFSWYNHGFTHTTADRTNTFHGAGYFNGSVSEAINAIKIYLTSGNIDQGVFKLYGVN